MYEEYSQVKKALIILKTNMEVHSKLVSVIFY